MSGYKKKVLGALLPLLIVVTGNVVATNDELTNAIQLYYDGSPDQAIISIRSLAQAGDAEAQYTLGNIFYSLSEANKHAEVEDFVIWYEKAVKQGSAEANTALGVVYHNQWIEIRRKEDAAKAISYYEKAIELGDADAEEHLAKLRRRGRFPTGTKLLPEYPVKSEQTTSTVEEQSLPELKTIPEPPVQTAVPSSEDGVDEANTESSTTTVKPETAASSDIKVTRINLTEVSKQCSNYTVDGFNHYGESITGSLLVGKATIETIEPPSASNTQLVRLMQQNSGAGISLSLHRVPWEITAKLVEQSKFAISGIITSAKMVGSNCNISLDYQPAE